MNPNEFAFRVERLVRRGLARPVSVDLWTAGDEGLIKQVEDATDAQIQELNALARAK